MVKAFRNIAGAVALAVTGLVSLTAGSARANVAEVIVPAAATVPALPIAVGAGAVIGTMASAAIVQSTQCRELTSAEAILSFFLPGIGTALVLSGPQNNMCAAGAPSR